MGLVKIWVIINMNKRELETMIKDMIEEARELFVPNLKKPEMIRSITISYNKYPEVRDETKGYLVSAPLYDEDDDTGEYVQEKDEAGKAITLLETVNDDSPEDMEFALNNATPEQLDELIEIQSNIIHQPLKVDEVVDVPEGELAIDRDRPDGQEEYRLNEPTSRTPQDDMFSGKLRILKIKGEDIILTDSSDNHFIVTEDDLSFAIGRD